MSFALREQYQLEDWQAEARDAWLNSDPTGLGPRHGILALFTGAGKTVVALAALAAVADEDPAMRFAIVAPNVALARQWAAAICTVTTLPESAVGVVGDGSRDSFASKRALVFVINSARRRAGGVTALARAVAGYRVTLVVDECHGAGSAEAKSIFEAKTVYRLGLSATPERPDVDEHGRPLPLEQQAHGAALGPVCFRLSLQDGYRQGLLPRYRITHHGITLSQPETREYEELSQAVSDASRRFERLAPGQAYMSVIRGRARGVTSDAKSAALRVQAALLARKRWLYNRPERVRVAEQVVLGAWRERVPPRGAILFNERIGEQAGEGEDEGAPVQGAETVLQALRDRARDGDLPFGPEQVVIEHSKMKKDERRRALDALRRGQAQILVSVKALQEGIDVPDVGMGVSIASTSTARQRIQTMGRILRRPRDAQGRPMDASASPIKELHLLYVRDTVDEAIYRREDWNDQTGSDRNVWLVWEHGADAAESGHVLCPSMLSEEDAWEEVRALDLPQPWHGPIDGLKLSYRSGSVYATANPDIEASDPEPMVALLHSVAHADAPWGDIRGRFRVSPQLGVVLKHGTNPLGEADAELDPEGLASRVWWALGKLDELPGLPLASDESHERDEDGERDEHGPDRSPGDAAVLPESGGAASPRAWYEWFEQLCFAVARGQRELALRAMEQVLRRPDHAGGVAGGGIHTAARLLVLDPGDEQHRAALRLARELPRPDFVSTGHAPLIALAHVLHDREELARLRDLFSAGGVSPKRDSMRRACELLLGERTPSAGQGAGAAGGALR